jgi:protein-S-isoprenylcysteine O-methyltransferase Ste14
MPYKSLCAIVFLVILAVGYQLSLVASATGNYEGLWFSLAHTVLVGAGVLLALRPTNTLPR